MAAQPVRIVFGGTRIGNRSQFTPGCGLETILSILDAHEISTIDTAQSYGDSEATLGKLQAGRSFIIDTKWSPPSWDDRPVAWATRSRIINSAENSVQTLQINQVDVFYLHRPDRLTPISETLSAVHEVYKRGMFRRFGLSGFSAQEVAALHGHCLKQGYPLPSVYQGSYNPINRYKEASLFPTLRNLSISFYAYAPSAGGFFAKTVSEVAEMTLNIASVSATCRPYLGDPKALEALAKWNDIALEEGLTAAELAYRWVSYHSALNRENGDAVIIGVSSPDQLRQTLNGIEKGPLSENSRRKIDKIWLNMKEIV